ncbi:MAG: DEAD/DEAH box helicase family protein [Flavobacteriaceae bacterium]|jgi:hypothetical protein|nr:DEAD/DEAH box helicase family protein [Flavobacteriaceae bacterium]
MELPNIHFLDFPIEFKKINPEDFPNFEVGDKITIAPNAEGYINDELQNNINLDEKNTVVINAGVGQGKTTTIIDIISRYYDDEQDYLIFIASPFVSLVEQYYNKVLQKGIPREQVYRYEWIGTNLDIDAWNSKIQIITANSLLGNSGEDSLINSAAKRNYLNYLVNKCEQNNRKVIFIFDEIHDAISNFKEEYVFNLWKWRKVLHKNFILSATYNEASKIVIEILAELTEDKIQIIESERIRFPEKQGDLYLHYNPAKSYKYDNEQIVNIVDALIEKRKQIDILSFSKILADDICNHLDSGVGKLLVETFGEVHNCTSDLNNNEREYPEPPENRYDLEKCNVGTNFKTGVSIEKENHAFIIIMPPLGRQSKFYKNNYGIFSNGINSVIQALARQRKRGEIHIIMPPPNDFNYETLPFTNEIQRTKFKEKYEEVKKHQTKITEYKPLSEQNDMLEDFYNNVLTSEIENEITHLQSINREGKIKLNYPEFKQFKLSKGEQYLSTYRPFFGKDLSAYITYCAFTNQFVNCNLVYINSNPMMCFQENNIQQRLEKYWEDNVATDIDYYNYLLQDISDRYTYYDLKDSIFSNYRVLFKNENQDNYQEISPFDNRQFEQQFIAFIQRKFYPQNREFKDRFVDNGNYIDSEYTRGDYFRSCIAHALEMRQNLDELAEDTKDLVKAYIIMNNFRREIIRTTQTREIKGNRVEYISKVPTENFISIATERINDFNEMINAICQKDIIISKDIFEYKRFLTSNESIEDKINRFYTYLKQDFFILKTRKIDRVDYDQILQELPIPEPNQVFNFVQPAEVLLPMEAMTQLKIIDGVPVYIQPYGIFS